MNLKSSCEMHTVIPLGDIQDVIISILSQSQNNLWQHLMFWGIHCSHQIQIKDNEYVQMTFQQISINRYLQINEDILGRKKFIKILYLSYTVYILVQMSVWRTTFFWDLDLLQQQSVNQKDGISTTCEQAYFMEHDDNCQKHKSLGQSFKECTLQVSSVTYKRSMSYSGTLRPMVWSTSKCVYCYFH